jgi:DNA-binding PadR family transcriptional regulator
VAHVEDVEDAHQDDELEFAQGRVHCADIVDTKSRPSTRLGADEAAHAVSIASDITERTGRLVRRANVYMTLQRLEDKGLLTTGLGEARPERGGKPRRLVSPTRAGVAAVRATMAAIQAMTRGVRI